MCALLLDDAELLRVSSWRSAWCLAQCIADADLGFPSTAAGAGRTPRNNPVGMSILLPECTAKDVSKRQSQVGCERALAAHIQQGFVVWASCFPIIVYISWLHCRSSWTSTLSTLLMFASASAPGGNDRCSRASSTALLGPLPKARLALKVTLCKMQPL